MKNIFTLLISFLVYFTAYSQEAVLKTTVDTKQLSEDVTKAFSRQNYSEAYDLMSKYWPLPINELESIEQQTIKQTNLVAPRFGNIIGYSFIKERKVNDFIINYIYVVKYEKHILRLSFTYYKNEKGYILNAFLWDDNIQKLFE